MENKQKRCVDLALAACRKRQSPRTGFVHFFEGSDEITDTIPLYENFCFVLALYRQKTVESVLEGKNLLERLLAFQAPDGNFPVYLHEFPKCRNPRLRLKIASLLNLLQHHFGSVLSPDLKERLSEFSEMPAEEEKPLPPFHPQLQTLMDLSLPSVQEGLEPRPHLLEWLYAEQQGHFSSRLLQNHPLQIQLAGLWPLDANTAVQEEPSSVLTLAEAPEKTNRDVFRLLWKGEKHLGSLVLPWTAPCKVASIGENGWEMIFDLPEEVDLSQNQTFEIAFYVSALPEIDWSINGKKATTFALGDTIQMESPQCRAALSLELIEGSGDFCGHLFKANRPSQSKASPFEAYDWRVGLRTLRRSSTARIRAKLEVLFI